MVVYCLSHPPSLVVGTLSLSLIFLFLAPHMTVSWKALIVLGWSMLVAVAWAGVSSSPGVILPMYTAGTPLTLSMRTSAWSEFGFPFREGQDACRRHRKFHQACKSILLPGTDVGFCMNYPEYMSRTPNFGMTGLDANMAGFVHINCGAGAVEDGERSPNGTMITYSMDGTLPSIFMALNPAPVTFIIPAGEEATIIARCVEPGKKPSRIAYAFRVKDRTPFACDGPNEWDIDSDHTPLLLPGCDHLKYGLDKCNGEGFVGPMPSTPTPTPPPPPPSNVPTDGPGVLTSAGETREGVGRTAGLLLSLTCMFLILI